MESSDFGVVSFKVGEVKVVRQGFLLHKKKGGNATLTLIMEKGSYLFPGKTTGFKQSLASISQTND